MFVYPHFCVHLDSRESSGDSVIDATATNALHPLRDKASVARHTIHKPAELSKSCVLDAFDESNASGGEIAETTGRARSSAVTPREPAVKAGQPGLESGVIRGNRWVLPRAGSRRGPAVGAGSVADGRFTFQSTPDESGERRDGASLLFSVPNKRLTNQTGIETRNLFFLRKEVIQPQVPLRLPCSCASTIRMAAWTISSSLS